MAKTYNTGDQMVGVNYYGTKYFDLPSVFPAGSTISITYYTGYSYAGSLERTNASDTPYIK